MANNFFELATPSEEQELFNAVDAFTPASTMDGMIAAGKTGYRNNLFSMAVDAARSDIEPIFNPQLNRPVSPGEAKEVYGLDIEEPITQIDATIRSERNQLLRRQEAIQQEAGLGGIGRFIGNMGGGLIDPLALLGGLAAGKAAVSVGNQMVNAGTMVKVGRVLNASAHSGTPQGIIAREMVENAVASTIIDIPLGEHVENIYNEDITAAEHLFNIGVGTLAGTMFRYLGRVFAKPDLDLNPEVVNKVVTKELQEANRTGRAPDPEKAIETWKAEQAEYRSNPDNIQNARRILEEEGTNEANYYVAHLEGQPEQVIRGVKPLTDDGIILTNNPAHAFSDTFHIVGGGVHKVDTSKLKLFELDEASVTAFDASTRGKVTAQGFQGLTYVKDGEVLVELFEPPREGSIPIKDDMKPRPTESTHIDPNDVEPKVQSEYKSDNPLWTEEKFGEQYKTVHQDADTTTPTKAADVAKEAEEFVQEITEDIQRAASDIEEGIELVREVESQTGIDPFDDTPRFLKEVRNIAEKFQGDPELFETLVKATIACMRRN